MMDMGPSDEIFASIVFVWRCFLAICICVPFFYFVWKIFTGIKILRETKDAKLRLLKKDFLKPSYFVIFGIWLTVVIYVFNYAYVWPIGAKVLPYSLFEIKNSNPCPQISIIPKDPLIARSGKDYAATCVSAARYFAKHLHSNAIIVKVYAFPPSGYYYGKEARVAYCVHDPDDDLWHAPDVDKATQAVASVTSQRLKINQLYVLLANDYRNIRGTLDTEALSAKVAELVDCPLDLAKTEELSLVPVFTPFLDSIEATPPINPERENILPQLNEIKNLAYSLYINASQACFFMGHKLDDKADLKEKEDFLDTWEHNLGLLEAHIANFKEVSPKFKQIPELFQKYLEACSKGENKNIYISKIYAGIWSE